MGQQQLLLVILVTIIVGIATVVAINVFGTSAASANVDAVRQDVLTIASASQGWYIKPKMMGGGGNSFTGMTFNDFNFSASLISATGGLEAENMNGRYIIESAEDGQSFTVTAHPSSCTGYAPTEGIDEGTATEVGGSDCDNNSDLLIATVGPQAVTWGTTPPVGGGS